MGNSAATTAYDLFDHVGSPSFDRVANEVLLPLRERLHASLDKRDPAWYLSYLLHYRTAKEFSPFLFAFIFFVGSISFFSLRKLFQSLKKLGCINLLHCCPAPRKEEPSFFNDLSQRQIVESSSSRRSYKIHREILPFELHSMCIDLSYDRFDHAVWLQEEYPDPEEYLCARNMYREAEFFENAKGACADKYGHFIEPIFEEEEEDAVFDGVHEVVLDAGSTAKGAILNNDDEWCDAHDREEDSNVESAGIIAMNIGTSSTYDYSSTVPNDIDHATGTSTGHPDYRKSITPRNKTQVEVVGTITTDAPREKPTLEPTKNTSLGSGFYVDAKCRERRFSHRLMAKKIVSVAKKK